MLLSRSEKRLGLRLSLASLLAAVSALIFTVLVVFVLSAFAPLRELDETAARVLHDHALRNPGFTQVLAIWTEVFGPWPWRVVVIGLAVWAAVRGQRRVAMWALTTLTVGGLLGLGMKLLTDRARPVLPDPVAWAPGLSFPSGHTVHATLGAGVAVLMLLPYLRRRWKALVWGVAVFLALSVGYTRIALGVHWVSDALGGVVFGVLVIAATTAAFEHGRPAAEPYTEGVEE